ncbi:uncharacterized protein [Trachinotus anak]|uniref:uncharacterized protein isoform X2 n=1 Tax=Trachinotus anak TaxID=443729 RepID=UPI0039F1E045
MADSNTVTTTVPLLINATSNISSPASVQVAKVISWLTFSFGLPAIALAIYALKNLSKDEDMASGTFLSSNATDFIFYFGIVSNVTLMLFIAQERHLLVAYPQCLGCCTSIRQSPAVTLLAWAAPFGILALAVLKYNLWFAVALLSPFPFLLFFAVDSWRALMCSRSNPATPERRRTVWGIAAIWANYTLLYVPFILSVLLEALSFKEAVRYLGLVSHLLLYLGPLVDPFLYIFMTKGFKEVLQALPCCQNSKQKEKMRPTVDTVAETVETRL